MLTNSFSPTAKLRSLSASTVSPMIAWKVLVRPVTSILAMSPRQIRVVGVAGHLQILLQKAQLVQPRQSVLQVLGHDPAVRPPVHVLLREVELLQHSLGRLEMR